MKCKYLESLAANMSSAYDIDFGSCSSHSQRGINTVPRIVKCTVHQSPVIPAVY